MENILAILIIYFLHWYLVYKTKMPKRIKWLSPFWFRYFWNVVLFLSFLPTATTGFLLYFGYPKRFLIGTHNQWGMVMIVVGFLHLLARIDYFIKS